MSRPVIRPAALAGVAVAALLVSGCAPVVDANWMPPAWTATTLQVIPGEVEPLSAEPGQPLAANVSPERIRQDGIGIQARYALLPGDAAFNDAVRAYVRTAIGARHDATGARYSPQAGAVGAGLADRSCRPGSTLTPAAEVLADPALAGPIVGGGSASVVCDVVWASGSVFGQRLRTVTSSGDGVVGDSVETLFTDTANGDVSTAAQLWAPDAAGALADDVFEGLRRAAGSLSLAPLGDPATLEQLAGAFATTMPSAAGGMQFTIPAGFTTDALTALGIPPTDAPLTILVPAVRADPLLTDLGRRVLASVGQPYSGPSIQNPGDVPVDCSLTPCVALTYDDGPSDLTPSMLDALGAHRASATFFAMGEKAKRYAATLQRMVAEGHLVGNHSWNHPSLPTLTDAQVAAQLGDTSAALQAASGQPITMFRPPYGEYTARVLAIARMPAILWDVDTEDWKGIADDVLIERAITQPRPGSIVLQHDIHQNTGRTVGAICDGLLDRGFTIVTIEKLFRGDVPTSGAWRSAR